MSTMKGKIVAIFERIVDAMEKEPGIQTDLLSVIDEILRLTRGIDDSSRQPPSLTDEDQLLVTQKINEAVDYIKRLIWDSSEMKLVDNITKDKNFIERVALEVYQECISKGIGPRISDESWTTLTKKSEDPNSAYANIIRRDILRRSLQWRQKLK